MINRRKGNDGPASGAQGTAAFDEDAALCTNMAKAHSTDIGWRVWRSVFATGVILLCGRTDSEAQFAPIPVPGGRLIKMAADYQRPYIYILQETATFGEPGRLLFLNITNGAIENTLPVGGGPTDLTINYGEGRLYVASGSEPSTYVVNLANQTLLPSLNLGTEVYRINAIRPGRIITEGRGPSYYLAMMDTVTGTNVSTSFNRVYEGDGEVDPGGAFYYHCDNNVSSAHIEKFAILDTVLTSTASSLQHPYGSRNLVMSRDGRRLFWFGYVYDTNLVELGGFGTEIFACTANGAVAFGASQVFDTATQAAMYDLPASSNVKAVDGPGQRLWFYTGDSAKTIESLPLAILQKPSITQQPTNQSVYRGDSALIAVGARGLSPMTYYWFLNGSNIAVSTQAQLVIGDFQEANAGTYSVVISNAFGTIASSGNTLTLMDSAPIISVQPVDSWGIVGSNLTLTAAAVGSWPLTYHWQFHGTNLLGATSSNLQLSNLKPSDEGTYRIVVSNALGSLTSSNAFLNVVDIAEALNTTNLVWTTGGEVPWSIQTGETQDGFAAMRSGIVAPGGQSTLRTEVVGPATLKFWWKATSGFYEDGLMLSINGVEWGRISWSPLWRQETVYLGEGTSVLEWSYCTTDPSYSGYVSGYLDLVTVTSGSTAPLVTLNPANQVVMAGYDATLVGSASGTPPLSYQWQFKTANLNGATASTLVLTNVHYSEEGDYRLLVSNPAGMTNTITAFLNVVDLAEALDATNLMWTVSGDNSWYPQTNTTHVGVAAGKSGTIGNNQHSDLQTLVMGPGALTFWWKVFSETNKDFASFSIDGKEQNRISGSVDWRLMTFYLDSGAHSLEWSYSKDALGGVGLDAVILDEVKYVAGGSAPIIIGGPADMVVALGGTIHLAVNAGGTPPLHYQWSYHGIAIPDATNAGISLTGLQLSDIGDYAVTITNSYGSAYGIVGRLHLRNLVAWGAGETNTYSLPNRGQSIVPTNVFATAVAGGAFHSLALKPDGKVAAWGEYNSQQTNVPASLTNVVALAAGYTHNLALQSNGAVVKWGILNYGTIGVPSSASNAVAVAAGWYHNLVLRSNGTVVAWGAGENLGSYSPHYWQSKVPTNLTGVKAIAGGGFHSLALRTNGTVVGWGWNAFGQTNIPGFLSNVVAIAAGASNSLALRNDGTVVAWGANGYGQTNVPVGLTNVLAIAAGAAHCLALRADGTLAAWGLNTNGQANIPSGLSNVTTIAAGAFHNLAMVNVGPVTFPGLPPSHVVYKGSDITVTAPHLGAQPMAFQWLSAGRSIDGATSPLLTITNVQFSDAGDYQLAISNYFGSVTSAVASVTVFDTAPFFTEPLTNRWVLLNSNVTLTASVGGIPPFSYQWFLDGTEIAGATSIPLGITNAQLSDEGSYALRVSNAFGVILSTNVFLNVVDLPDALGQAGLTWYNSGQLLWFPQTTNTQDGFAAAAVGPLPQGSRSTVATTVTGPGKLSFGCATARNATLFFSIDESSMLNLSQYFSTWYNATFYLSAGAHTLSWTAYGSFSYSSAFAFLDQVTFVPGVTPVQITSHPVDQTNSAGANVTFAATAPGTPPISFQWLFNGAAIPGRTGSSCTISNIQTKDMGVYSLVVSNQGGAVLSSNASLVVIPSAPTVVAHPASTQAMIGQTAVFTGGAVGSEPIQYQWLRNGAAIPGATQSSLAIGDAQADDSGNYALQAGNAYGSVVTSNAFLQVYSVADIASALDVPGVTWSTSNALWFPQTNTTHDGVFAVQSGVISESQRSTLQGDITGPATVSFWWKVNCDSFWVNLAFSIDGVIQNAIGGTVDWQQVSAFVGEGNHTLSWELYPIRGWFAGGTGWLDQVEVVPGATPVTIALPPTSSTNSAGNNITFSVTASGTPPLRYQWQFNGLDVPSATNATLSLNNIQATNGGTYSVTVTNSISTATSSNAVLVVNESAPFLTTSPFGRSAAFNGTVSFSVTARGSDPLSYQWLFNGLPIPGASQPTLWLSDLLPADAGIYRIVVTNDYGAVTSGAYSLELGRTAVVEYGSMASPSSYTTPFGLTNVLAVAAGYSHTMALREDGTVTAWGSNNYGQTNVPFGLSNVVAIAAGFYHSVALKSDGTIAEWGDNSYGQQFIPPGLTNVSAIAAAGYHTFALKTDGTVVGWGRNNYGQLNIPPGLEDLVSIAAGVCNGFAVKSDGRAVQWGTGPTWLQNGVSTRLTLPEGTRDAVAIAAGTFEGWTLHDDGVVSGWGMLGQITRPGIAMVAAFGDTSLYEYGLLLGNDGRVAVIGSTLSFAPNIPVGQSNAVGIAAGYSRATVLIGDGSPRVARPMARRTVHTSSTTVLGSGVVGAMPLSYQWQFNGTDLPGETSALLTFTNVPFSAAGNYRCIVANAYGIVTNGYTTLTVLRSTPRFGLLSLPSGGGFALQLDQLSGHGPVVIMTSTNLADWSPIFTNPPVTGSLIFQDPAMTSDQRRFYRAVEE